MKDVCEGGGDEGRPEADRRQCEPAGRRRRGGGRPTARSRPRDMEFLRLWHTLTIDGHSNPILHTEYHSGCHLNEW